MFFAILLSSNGGLCVNDVSRLKPLYPLCLTHGLLKLWCQEGPSHHAAVQFPSGLHPLTSGQFLASHSIQSLKGSPHATHFLLELALK